MVTFLANNTVLKMREIMLSVLVTKADGTRQYFDKNKVIRTCMRMGASREGAEAVASKIEDRLYPGIETKKILQMIFRYMRIHKPATRHQIDLRRALSLLAPKPDFEVYVQTLLREHGYHVQPNTLLRGMCVEHEVDGIATRDGRTCFVEVKHHYLHHTQTNLDVTRIARAVYEDVTEGYAAGVNDTKIDYAMIVCNTKLSDPAKRYADCRGIHSIGWSSPPNNDLQTLIETRKLYPITYLRGLNVAARQRLTVDGIILLKQFVEADKDRLRKLTGFSGQKLESMLGYARAILSGV
jgi:hypothetical protein